jgi:hypothetical protein
MEALLVVVLVVDLIMVATGGIIIEIVIINGIKTMGIIMVLTKAFVMVTTAISIVGAPEIMVMEATSITGVMVIMAGNLLNSFKNQTI